MKAVKNMPKRLDRFCGFNINLIIGSAIITCLYAVSSIVWIAIALTDDKNRYDLAFFDYFWIGKSPKSPEALTELRALNK